MDDPLYLGCNFRDAHFSVRRTSACRQRGETGNEEVKSGEGDHVDGQLTEIRVKLTRETETRGHPGHRILQRRSKFIFVKKIRIDLYVRITNKVNTLAIHSHWTKLIILNSTA
jgi:hypothetical protein